MHPTLPSGGLSSVTASGFTCERVGDFVLPAVEVPDHVLVIIYDHPIELPEGWNAVHDLLFLDIVLVACIKHCPVVSFKAVESGMTWLPPVDLLTIDVVGKGDAKRSLEQLRKLI